MQELIIKILQAAAGLLLFCYFFINQFRKIIRESINYNKAIKELPILSKELKLHHIKGEGFGSYYGRWNKHKILIEPNNYRTAISISISGEPQFSAFHQGISEKFYDLDRLFHFLTKILIKFIPDYPDSGEKNPAFNFNNPLLDKYFKERRLLGGRNEKTVFDQGLQEAIIKFLMNNRKKIKNLFIGKEISCSLWLGSSSSKRSSYSITAGQVKRMLSEMLPIAEELDRILKTNQNTMIKAILFDYDGVLTPDKTGSYSICRYISEQTGIEFNKLSASYKKYNNDLLYGQTSHEEIWDKLCKDLNEKIDIKHLYYSFVNTPVNKPVFALVKKLKKSYKTGLITDNKKDRMKAVIQCQDLNTIFDAVIISADIGSGKDNEKIFAEAAASLEVKYTECVFIDNQAKNLIIPEKLGMKTIFYNHEKNDTEGLISDLKKLNIKVN